MKNRDCDKQRIPNFDLLRVLAMLLIVVSHFFTHGLGGDLNFPISLAGIFEHLLCEMISLFSSIAVDLYVLITGYFLIKAGVRWSKIIHIWVQTAFYSLVIYVFFSLYGIVNFDFNSLLRNLLVVRFGAVSDCAYWFVAQYIGLVLLSPFINKLVNSLDAERYRIFIIVLLILDFSALGIGYGSVFSGGQTLFHFIVLYSIAGYIRMYVHVETIKQKCLIIYTLILLVLPCAIIQILEIYVHHDKSLRLHSIFNSYNGIPIVLAVLLFITIAKMRLRHNFFVSLITRIAPYTFGVYLIHDNIYIRNRLWSYVISIYNITDDNIIMYSLLIPVVIFSICILIDYIRKLMFNIIGVDSLLDKGLEKLRLKDFII